MKRLDVTHEDLLAAAVLEYIGYRDSEEVLIEAVPLAVHDVLWRRQRAMAGEWWSRFRRLIVVLERQASIEQAERAVVDAATAWGISIMAGKRSNGDLVSAVCILEAVRMGQA